MPGRHNIERTCRVIKKILRGVLYKQISFEEKISQARISYIKGHYTRQTIKLELNAEGVALMNGSQLDLLKERERKGRNSILRRLGKDNKKNTWDQGI